MKVLGVNFFGTQCIIFGNGNFREFLHRAGGDFKISEREFPMALIQICIRRCYFSISKIEVCVRMRINGN